MKTSLRLSLAGLIVATMFGGWAYGYGSLTDTQLAAKNAANDRALLQKYAVKNAKIASALVRTRPATPLNLSFLNAKDNDGCVDQCVSECQGGAGSAACWQKCTLEDNTSDTCAARCGVTTPAGSDACWRKCGLEDYSSDVCAPRCGVATGAGSADCWQRCNLEDYSSDVCAPRCGVSTPEGSAACWQRCNLEGYSSDVCASRCGHND